MEAINLHVIKIVIKQDNEGVKDFEEHYGDIGTSPLYVMSSVFLDKTASVGHLRRQEHHAAGSQDDHPTCPR
jgi:hypothetical protein